MTSEEEKRPEIDRLQYLLDVYGGDRDRWPLRERLAVAEFLTRDQEAQRLLRDAQLLDRLIEGSHLQVPQRRTQSQDMARLSNRILAQAQQRQSAPAGEQRSRIVQLKRRQSRIWQAAGLLAACLVIGIMVGRSGVLLADGAQVSDTGSVEDSLAGLLPDEGLIFFPEEDMI